MDTQGGKTAPLDYAALLVEPRGKLQGLWGEKTSAVNRTRLLQALDEERRLALRGASGPGAGGWLLPRQPGDPKIPDEHFVVNFNTRLGRDVLAPGLTCQHRNATTGEVCGQPLDTKGWHARKCGCGGSRDYRHDSLRDWHATWHTAHTGYAATTEKRVVAWDRQLPNGELQEARLDVATRDPATAATIYVDWSVTCEHSDNLPRRTARANTDGLAAAQAVDRKRVRYPPAGGELVPAVLESGGRASDELVAFVRSYGQDLPEAERSTVIAEAWRQIHRTLAVGNAEMIPSAC